MRLMNSKYRVLSRKSEALPLLKHVSAAFQIYIKFTPLSQKSDIKNLDPSPAKYFASYLPTESSDHLGARLRAKCFQSWRELEFKYFWQYIYSMEI